MQLEEAQDKELQQLSAYNSLVRALLTHIFDIESKRAKKKNKRKKKKQTKKEEDPCLEKKPLEAEEELDAEDLVSRLLKLKIDDSARSACFYDSEWLRERAGRLSDT